jgi:hypothetical protein
VAREVARDLDNLVGVITSVLLARVQNREALRDVSNMLERESKSSAIASVSAGRAWIDRQARSMTAVVEDDRGRRPSARPVVASRAVSVQTVARGRVRVVAKGVRVQSGSGPGEPDILVLDVHSIELATEQRDDKKYIVRSAGITLSQVRAAAVDCRC